MPTPRPGKWRPIIGVISVIIATGIGVGIWQTTQPPSGGGGIPSLSSVPVVSGTVQTGQTLTTSNGSWSNSPSSFTYAWQFSTNSGTTWKTIQGGWHVNYGQTTSALSIPEDYGTSLIRSMVTATNGSGSAIGFSTATSAVTSMANEVVDFVNGSDTTCSRQAGKPAASTFTNAQKCKTLTKAYTIASVGDEVKTVGTDTTREFFTQSMRKADNLGNCNYLTGLYDACITFSPTVGPCDISNPSSCAWQQAYQGVTTCPKGPCNSQIGVCVPYLRVQSLAIQKLNAKEQQFTGTDGQVTNGSTTFVSPSANFNNFQTSNNGLKTDNRIEILGVKYAITAIDVTGTTLTLATPYAGATSSSASWVAGILDFVSNGAISFGSGDSTCFNGVSDVNHTHDELVENVSVGGNGGLAGCSHDAYFVGGVAEGSDQFPWQYYGRGNNGNCSGMQNWGMVGFLWRGSNFTDGDSTWHHMECIHMDMPDGTGNGFLWKANVFIGTCPLYDLSIQVYGTGALTNSTITDSAFSTPSSPGTCLYLNMNNTGGTITNNTVSFNTFETGCVSYSTNGKVCPAQCTISGNLVYGNINSSCVTAPPGYAFTYNVENSAATGQCAGETTGAYNVTTQFADISTDDLHLANCSQTAADFVLPSNVPAYPSVDADGVTRPQGVKLDDGAYETCPVVTAAIKSGASLATCSPSACTATGAAVPSHGSLSTPPSCTAGVEGSGSVNLISVGSIADGSGASQCRVYGFYVPKNLTGAAPVIFVAPGTNGVCGNFDPENGYQTNHWADVAVANRLIVVYLSKPYNGSSCTTGTLTSWRHPNIDACTGIGGTTCPGATDESDEPYITAVINDIQNNSRFGTASPDTARYYMTGASGGGSMTLDVGCDLTNRPKFRGINPVSAWFQTTYKVGGSGTSISNQVLGSERCTAGGNGAGVNYNGGPNSPTDRAFFWVQSHGVLDGNVAFNGTCVTGNPHCVAGFTENSLFLQKYMGCNVTPTVVTIGTPNSQNELDDYGSCTYGVNDALETWKIDNNTADGSGCHSWQGLDAVVNPLAPSGQQSSCSGGTGFTNPTNGFDSAAQAWAFFSSRQWTGP